MHKARIEKMATAHIMEQAYNLILESVTGTGKTHLVTAFAIAAIHFGKLIGLYYAADLDNWLETRKRR